MFFSLYSWETKSIVEQLLINEKKVIKWLARIQTGFSTFPVILYDLIGSLYWCPHSPLTCFQSLKKSERILKHISFGVYTYTSI